MYCTPTLVWARGNLPTACSVPHSTYTSLWAWLPFLFFYTCPWFQHGFWLPAHYSMVTAAGAGNHPAGCTLPLHTSQTKSKQFKTTSFLSPRSEDHIKKTTLHEILSNLCNNQLPCLSGVFFPTQTKTVLKKTPHQRNDIIEKSHMTWKNCLAPTVLSTHKQDIMD